MATVSIAEVTDRLVAEFAPGLSRPAIAAAVRACVGDLDGSPEAALPELVERLARQRLLSDLTRQPPDPG